MRVQRAARLVALAIAVVSCSDQGPPAQILDLPLGAHLVGPEVRISELHYDNTGTDAGEAIEISGPAGADLAGWQVVLYNGNGGTAYNTTVLTTTLPATCGVRGVVVVTYAVNGIQNGSPDGVALVNPAGGVVEFLSYEGVFTAADGPAIGLPSTDIGVGEAGAEPLGQSLQRHGDNTWTGPTAATFGACNDDDEPPPTAEVASVTVAPATATILVGGTQTFTAVALDAANQPIPGVAFTWSSTAPSSATVTANGVATGVAPGDAGIVAAAPNGVAGSAQLHVNEVPPPTGLPDTRFSEIHYDNVGTDANEAIEIEGPAGTDLTSWSVVLYNGTDGAVYNTQTLSGIVTDQCDGRGTLAFNYPVNGIQNGSPDGMALVDATGAVVEFLSYEGTFVAVGGAADGLMSSDVGADESSSPLGQSLQRNASNVWALAQATFGACNGSGPPPPQGNTISFSGRVPSDPALPVGFEDQLFATLRDPNNVTIPTTFTWSSETPAVATIDANGVFVALSAGTATLRATAADGTTGVWSLPTDVGVASSTALYAGNAEFGEPTDADPSDDFVVRRDQYTASYSQTRGGPNWVSYELDPTHFGPEDRCDCFTFDPALPSQFTRYTTADYTGAGAFHGYGIDRGHLARSFDRTSASLDNATTFLFTNIVPQAADLNQGPWAVLENVLGDSARFGNREVYIVAGVAGNKGTIKNEGKIVIPEVTWKVALILPHDHGLADVHTLQDLTVIAAIMPNEPGVRNTDWNTYRVTVDQVEAVSGYDLLALLPDQLEIALESGTSAPIAVTDGPYAAPEGSAVTMSAAGSSDPDGDALVYAWDFGDGGTGSGVVVSHTYALDGEYTVSLTVRDGRGLTSLTTTTASIAALPAPQRVQRAIALVQQLVALGKLSRGASVALRVELEIALRLIERDRPVLAAATLGGVLRTIDLLVRSGRLSAADAALLRELVLRLKQSIV